MRPAAPGVLLVIAILFTAACAAGGGVPRPFPGPRAAPAPAGVQSVAGTALELLGAPYRRGGADPAGFDCSGFVAYVFGQHGIQLPRTVDQLFGVGRQVRPLDLEPGDLLFFSTVASGASHVAIAVGGDEFVHAPSGRGRVRVEQLSSGYWASRFVGARRVPAPR